MKQNNQWLAWGTTMLFLVVTSALWLSGWLCVGPVKCAESAKPATGSPPATAAGQEANEAGATAHCDADDECKTAEARKTDLASIEQQKCEHDRPILSCSGCLFEAGIVQLKPEIGASLLTIGQATAGEWRATLALTGEVSYNPSRVAQLVAPVAGTVMQVHVTLGDTVKVGDPLLTLRSAAVGEAKAAAIAAKAERRVAERFFEREQDLFTRKVCSEAELIEARKNLLAAQGHDAAATHKLQLFGLDPVTIAALGSDVTALNAGGDGELGQLVLRATQAGVVIELAAVAGQLTDGATPLATVADLAELWVWCDLYERDLAVLQPVPTPTTPVPALLQFAAYPGAIFPGQLDLLGSAVQETTRTIKARIRVANPDGRLKPGMFATVEARAGQSEPAVLVPRTAVLSDAGAHFVFRRLKGDFWIQCPVTLGREMGDQISLLSGINAGDDVVTGGGFMLKSDVLREKMGAGCAD